MEDFKRTTYLYSLCSFLSKKRNPPFAVLLAARVPGTYLRDATLERSELSQTALHLLHSIWQESGEGSPGEPVWIHVRLTGEIDGMYTLRYISWIYIVHLIRAPVYMVTQSIYTEMGVTCVRFDVADALAVLSHLCVIRVSLHSHFPYCKLKVWKQDL